MTFDWLYHDHSNCENFDICTEPMYRLLVNNIPTQYYIEHLYKTSIKDTRFYAVMELWVPEPLGKYVPCTLASHKDNVEFLKEILINTYKYITINCG